MMKAILIRELSTDAGTFGRLCVYRPCVNALCFDTLELPWLDNKRSVSCIFDGEYTCVFRQTGKGQLYQVLDVPGRDGILIHRGNWAGRADLKMRCDSEGCILIGEGRTDDLMGQPGILKTVEALNRFHAFCKGEVFRLKIQWRS